MSKLTSTRVRVKCLSKKEETNYSHIKDYKDNPNASWVQRNPVITEIELNVPYDVNSIYHQLSGQTSLKLRTVNKDAADMFEIGGEYFLDISPAD